MSGLFLDRALVEIATSVDTARPGLRRVLLDPEQFAAVATDTYRLAVQPVDPDLLAGFSEPMYVEADLLAGYLKARQGMPKFSDLVEVAVGANGLAFPQWSHLVSHGLVASSALRWEGDGSALHGKYWAEFSMALERWAFYNGDRRKPVGMIRLEVDGEGRLFYRLGMRTETPATKRTKASTFFSAFEEHAREVSGLRVEGLVSLEGVLGTYAADYLRSVWTRDVDEVGIMRMSTSAPLQHQPLWFRYGSGGRALLMPIRI